MCCELRIGNRLIYVWAVHIRCWPNTAASGCSWELVSKRLLASFQLEWYNLSLMYYVVLLPFYFYLHANVSLLASTLSIIWKIHIYPNAFVNDNITSFQANTNLPNIYLQKLTKFLELLISFILILPNILRTSET